MWFLCSSVIADTSAWTTVLVGRLGSLLAATVADTDWQFQSVQQQQTVQNFVETVRNWVDIAHLSWIVSSYDVSPEQAI